jgi:hypothetical protein
MILSRRKRSGKLQHSKLGILTDKPEWLDEKAYREGIQPRLASITVPTIMSAISVSEPYALRIRAGRCVPHRRHWLALAGLTGIPE